MNKIFRTDDNHDSILKDWYQKNKDLDYDKEKTTKGKSVKNLIRESLLKMQLGFCAYTEKFLEKGTIDHFDPSLKHVDGFNFNNLFLIEGEVNTSRRDDLGVPKYLKPDDENYDPEKYLIFDPKDGGIYRANPMLDLDLQRVIESEILILGINLVKNIRQKRTKIVYKKLHKNDFPYTIIEGEEYQTAYKLAKNT